APSAGGSLIATARDCQRRSTKAPAAAEPRPASRRGYRGLHVRESSLSTALPGSFGLGGNLECLGQRSTVGCDNPGHVNLSFSAPGEKVACRLAEGECGGKACRAGGDGAGGLTVDGDQLYELANTQLAGRPQDSARPEAACKFAQRPS